MEEAVVSYNDAVMSGQGLQNIKTVGSSGAYVSEDAPNMAEQYIQFNWEEAVSFDRVILSSQYCGTATEEGQAPTAWEIYVSENGTDGWTKVAESGTVSWASGDSLQDMATDFETVSDVLGVRVKITAANLSWNHYAVYSIQIGSR